MAGTCIILNNNHLEEYKSFLEKNCYGKKRILAAYVSLWCEQKETQSYPSAKDLAEFASDLINGRKARAVALGTQESEQESRWNFDVNPRAIELGLRFDSEDTLQRGRDYNHDFGQTMQRVHRARNIADMFSAKMRAKEEELEGRGIFMKPAEIVAELGGPQAILDEIRQDIFDYLMKSDRQMFVDEFKKSVHEIRGFDKVSTKDLSYSDWSDLANIILDLNKRGARTGTQVAAILEKSYSGVFAKFHLTPKVAAQLLSKYSSASSYASKKKDAYVKMFNNFKHLTRAVIAQISYQENLRISSDYLSANGEAAKIDIDNEEDDGGIDAYEGTRDQLFNNATEINPKQALSAKVRRYLYNIKQRTSKGGVVHDDIGNATFVDRDKAYATLSSIFKDMTDSSQIDECLRANEAKHPWLASVRKDLKNDPNLKTAIYVAMHKNVNLFLQAQLGQSHVGAKETEFSVGIMNMASTTQFLENKWRLNIQAGLVVSSEDYSLYTSDGLFRLSSVNRVSFLAQSLKSAYNQMLQKATLGKTSETAVLDAIKKFFDKDSDVTIISMGDKFKPFYALKTILNAAGIDITSDEIGKMIDSLQFKTNESRRVAGVTEQPVSILTDENARERAEFLLSTNIMGMIDGIINVATNMGPKHKTYKTTEFDGYKEQYIDMDKHASFDIINDNGSDYGKLAANLLFTEEDGADLCTYVNNKMHYAVTNTNFIFERLKRIKSRLQSQRASLKDYMFESFKNDDFFAINTPDGRKYVNQFFEELENDEELREHLDINILLACGEQDPNFLSDEDKQSLIYSLFQSYSKGKTASHERGYARYVLPVPAEASQFYTIVLPKYGDDSSREALLNSMAKRFLMIAMQEYNRIQDTKEREKLFRKYEETNGKEGLNPSFAITNKDMRCAKDGVGGAKFCFMPALNTFKVNGKTISDLFREASEAGNDIATIINGLGDGSVANKHSELLNFMVEYLSSQFKTELEKYEKQGLVNHTDFYHKEKKIGERGKALDYDEVKNELIAFFTDGYFAQAYPNDAQLWLDTINHIEWSDANNVYNTLNTIIEAIKGHTDVPGINDFVSKVRNLLHRASDAEMALLDYYLNTAYAQANVIQMITGDFALYKDEDDWVKRAKEYHAPITSIDSHAIDQQTGKEIGGKMRFFIAKEIKTPSRRLEDIRAVLARKMKDQKELDSIMEDYSTIEQSDGQTLRTLPSLRKIMIGTARWDGYQEFYEKLTNPNYKMTADEMRKGFELLKPYMYGFVNQQWTDSNGNTRNSNVAMQIKTAESIMLGAYFAVDVSLGRSKSMKQLNEFCIDNDIDFIAFESAVKVGGTAAINVTHVPIEYIQGAVQDKDGRFYLHFDKIDPDGNIIEKAVPGDKNTGVVCYDYKQVVEYALPIKRDELRNKILDKFNWNNSDINLYSKDENGESYLEVQCRQQNVVKEFDVNSYGEQQPLHDHIYDVNNQNRGSQAMTIIPTGHSATEKMFVDQHTKECIERLSGIRLDKSQSEFKDIYRLYIDAMTEKIIRRYRKVSDRFKTIDGISAFLKEMLADNANYSRDLMDACDVVIGDDGRKRFNIPLSEPLQATKIMSVFCSIMRTQITKQTVNGGACVQVTSRTYDDGLDVRFIDKDGNIVFTEKEFKNGKTSHQKYAKHLEMMTSKYSTYADYKAEHQSNSVYCFEVKMKCYDSKLEVYKNADGTFNMDAIPDELRTMMGYRIPTEDKYSIAPMFITEFLPEEASNSIYLPVEWVTITGSDFDADKTYLYSYEMEMDFSNLAFNVDIAINEPTANARDLREQFKKCIKKFDTGRYTFDFDELVKQKRVNEFIDAFKDKVNIKMQKVDGDSSKPIQEWGRKSDIGYIGERELDNLILDLSMAIMRSESSSQDMLTPGEFKIQKRDALVARICTECREGRLKVDDIINETISADTKGIATKLKDALKHASTKELNAILGKAQRRDPLSMVTWVENKSRVANSKKMVGIMAVSSNSHMKMVTAHEMSNGMFNPTLKEGSRFCIYGKRAESLVNETDRDNVSITKIKAGSIGAATDDVKFPTLTYRNINEFTAALANIFIELGYSDLDATLITISPIVMEMTKMHQSGYRTNKAAINEVIKAYKERARAAGASFDEVRDADKNLNNDPNVLTEDYMYYQAVMGGRYLGDNAKEFYLNQIKIGAIFRQLYVINSHYFDLTSFLRADSVNGGAGKSIPANIKKINDLLTFMKYANGIYKSSDDKSEDFPFEGLEGFAQIGMLESNGNDINNPEFQLALNQSLFKYQQAAWSLGIESMQHLLRDSENGNMPLMYHFNNIGYSSDGTSYTFLDLIQRITDNYSPNRRLSVKTIEQIYNDAATAMMQTNSSMYDSYTDAYGNVFEVGGVNPITGKPGLTKIDVMNILVNDVPNKLKLFTYNSGFNVRGEILDNEFLKRLKARVSSRKDTFNSITFSNVGKMNIVMRELFGDEWAAAMYSDNPLVSQLATDLFRFESYVDGGQFDPRTFTSMANVSVRRAVPGYVEAVERLADYDGIDLMIDNPFGMEQYFVLNHTENPDICTTIKYDRVIDGSTFVDAITIPSSLLVDMSGSQNQDEDKNIGKARKQLSNLYSRLGSADVYKVRRLFRVRNPQTGRYGVYMLKNADGTFSTSKPVDFVYEQIKPFHTANGFKVYTLGEDPVEVSKKLYNFKLNERLERMQSGIVKWKMVDDGSSVSSLVFTQGATITEVDPFGNKKVIDLNEYIKRKRINTYGMQNAIFRPKKWQTSSENHYHCRFDYPRLMDKGESLLVYFTDFNENPNGEQRYLKCNKGNDAIGERSYWTVHDAKTGRLVGIDQNTKKPSIAASVADALYDGNFVNAMIDQDIVRLYNRFYVLSNNLKEKKVALNNLSSNEYIANELQKNYNIFEIPSNAYIAERALKIVGEGSNMHVESHGKDSEFWRRTGLHEPQPLDMQNSYAQEYDYWTVVLPAIRLAMEQRYNAQKGKLSMVLAETMLSANGATSIVHESNQMYRNSYARAISQIINEDAEASGYVHDKIESGKVETPVLTSVMAGSVSEAKSHPNIIYVFFDNEQRTSGSHVIEDGEYAAKYSNGQQLHRNHARTSAGTHLRGIPNAMPLTLQKEASKMYNDTDYHDVMKRFVDELTAIKHKLCDESNNYNMIAFNERYFMQIIGKMYENGNKKLANSLVGLYNQFKADLSDMTVEQTIEKKKNFGNTLVAGSTEAIMQSVYDQADNFVFGDDANEDGEFGGYSQQLQNELDAATANGGLYNSNAVEEDAFNFDDLFADTPVGGEQSTESTNSKSNDNKSTSKPIDTQAQDNTNIPDETC